MFFSSVVDFLGHICLSRPMMGSCWKLGSVEPKVSLDLPMQVDDGANRGPPGIACLLDGAKAKPTVRATDAVAVAEGVRGFKFGSPLQDK